MVTFRLGTSLLVPPNVKVALELSAPSGFHFQEALLQAHAQHHFQRNSFEPPFHWVHSKTLQPYYTL